MLFSSSLMCKKKKGIKEILLWGDFVLFLRKRRKKKLYLVMGRFRTGPERKK
jgi:hypothetical protein